MRQRSGYSLDTRTKLLLAMGVILTLASGVYTKSGYQKYDYVTLMGWPFPWMSTYYGNEGGFLILGFILSTLYWYGMSYFAYSIFLVNFPDLMGMYGESVEWRYCFPEETYRRRREPERVRVPQGDREYSEGEKAYYAEQYKWRGLAYLVYGFFEFAVLDFTKTIDLNPNNPKSYYRRGYAYSWLREYEKAVADYDKAIEYKPDNVRYRLLRAKALLELGRLEDAEVDVLRALDLDERNEIATRLLGEIRKGYGS